MRLVRRSRFAVARGLREFGGLPTRHFGSECKKPGPVARPAGDTWAAAFVRPLCGASRVPCNRPAIPGRRA